MNPNETIEHNFRYHAPTEKSIPKFEHLRAKFKELALEVSETCPDSRERAIAMTHLETSMFWANASIARAPQEPDSKTLVEIFGAPLR